MNMKKLKYFYIIASLLSLFNSVTGGDKLILNHLTDDEKNVIINKATEPPFVGIYVNHNEEGVYLCKQCNTPLYRSTDKFDSQCGWPSFDDEIQGAVKRIPDKDGVRTEIVCATCGAHLGHVFTGEWFTDKNTRHCVNSISLIFKSKEDQKMDSVAYFAGGCFWGTEFLFQKLDGVLDTKVGYMGGKTENPTYEEVCSGKTGHYEAVKVTYDPDKLNYETLAHYFFEIHDPTQENGQGPDIGEQYKSIIFCSSEKEKKIVEKLIAQLKKKGYHVATVIKGPATFWEAEEYHQDYYKKHGTFPYCHAYTKRF